MTLIHDRPAVALERVEPGNREGDLIVGAGNPSAIVTIVERTTRYTLLGHLPGARHDSAIARDGVVAALADLPTTAPAEDPHLGPGHGDGPPRRDRRSP